MKLLTISIAGYKVERYIAQVMNSLLCKNIDRLEIFVIDDGGNDRTLQIAEEYQQQFPDSIHLIHKDNGGWGSTVNYAIEHSTGKYFKLLDGDDFYDTRNLDKFIEKLEDIEADVIYTPYTQFDHKTGAEVVLSDISSSYELYKTYKLQYTETAEGLEMHALTFRTEVLKTNNVSITEKRFYTDNEYRTKGLAFSNTIVYTDILLYHYRVGLQGQSVDKEGYMKHYDDAINIAKTLVDFHRTGNGQWPPVVMSCVKNATDFAYRVLLFLPKKKELTEFDNYIKSCGDIYYKTDLGVIKLLRLLNMHCIGAVSLYFQTGVQTHIMMRKILKTF